MEFVLPLVIGLLASVAVLGARRGGPIVLTGLGRWWERRRGHMSSSESLRAQSSSGAEWFQEPNARHEHAPAMDLRVRSAVLVRRRSKVSGGPAISMAGMDVVGHDASSVGVMQDADREVEEAETPVQRARDDFWRTNGSTDCAGCASSRVRGASFCLRCGRQLV